MIDDVVGEVFDKVVKMFGFFYFGGLLIDKYVQVGNFDVFWFFKLVVFELDYSFFGLKILVLYFLQKE